jgi:hypothetical protein
MYRGMARPQPQSNRPQMPLQYSVFTRLKPLSVDPTNGENAVSRAETGLDRNSNLERTMLGMLSLHALAMRRGDGLRPELKRVFEEHARPTMPGSNVVPFDTTNNTRPSGPPAPARVPHDLPEGGDAFPGRPDAKSSS